MLPLRGLLPFTLPRDARSTSFNTTMIPDLTGKIAFVTGANSGVGYWTAFYLSLNGADVVLGCRSAKKCEDAMEEIVAGHKKVTGGERTPGRVATIQLDTSSMKSTKQCAIDFKSRYGRLDYFVLNAGISVTPSGKYERSVDGFELVFHTDHLGHFQLFQDLRPLIEETSVKYGSAVLTHVSSAAHYSAGVDAGSFPAGVPLTFEEVTQEARWTGFANAYAEAKLANVLFSNAIARQMQASGNNVLTNAIHPGAVETAIWGNMLNFLTSNGLDTVSNFMAYMRDNVMWKGEEGALTQLYATVSHDIVVNRISGKYLHPIAKEQPTSKFATDVVLQNKLWDFSEECLKSKGY